jgi:NAD(P)-dependent dehydrogenase (short-subunit alcohol dehydrogenase family)
MLALPETEMADEADDTTMREMSCDPRDRRVLVTNGRSAVGQAVTRALVAAGATVLVGIADAWRPFAPVDGADAIDLDITDTDSVRRAAAEFGGRVEIVVNTAMHVRPGGIIGRGDVVTARDEMEIGYFGLMRLAQAFGPALRFRGADGTHAACAWVNLLSVHGLVSAPAWGGFSAAQAAALSLTQTLRAELRPGGIRVVTLFVGPLDDEWHQSMPPPKVSPAAIGTAIVRALRDGVEEVAVGDVAQDIVARWRDDPDILAREMMEGIR